MSEISREELDAVIAKQEQQDKEVAQLRKENAELKGLASDGAAKKVKEITERYAEVRMVDDRVVIGFKNRGVERRPRYIYSKSDPLDPTTQVNFVDIILEPKEGETEETVLSVNHNEFLKEAERVKAKIVKTIEHEWVINQGQTRRKEVDGWSLVELDTVVDLDVRGVTREHLVRLPAEFGERELTIYEDYINM